MLHDLRFAWRMLRRAPGFSAIAILVLALGIGANTAIFSLVNAVLLAPLPFPHPEQLVALYETERAPGNYPLSGPDFPDWQAQSTLFAGMTLINYNRNMNLTGIGAGEAGAIGTPGLAPPKRDAWRSHAGARAIQFVPQRVAVTPVEANYFQLLGVPAAAGRMFSPDEGAPGHFVAVLSHSLWESRFAGNPAAIGQTIPLDGAAYTIIGVAPASFRLLANAELWTAMDLSPKTLGQRGSHSFSAIGRLKPGVTVAQAQSEIAAIAARLGKTYPDSNADTGARVFALHDRLVRATQRRSLWMLEIVAGLVLLIACANVANLLLARALSRQKEMAVRLALGAGRGQLMRQLLVESVLLACCGATAGAGIAWIGVRSVTAWPGFPLPRFNAIGVNFTALAFSLALAIGCGVLFGLAPAWQMSRPQLQSELGAASLLAGGRRRWLSDTLIVAEVALALVLVVLAGQFIQSFARLRTSPLGVNPTSLVTAGVTLPDAAYATPAKIEQFNRRFVAALQAVPGIQAAAVSSELPIEGGNNGYITLPGDKSEEQSLVEWTRISPSYFATMQIPILAGRGYTDADAQQWNDLVNRFYGPTPPPPSATAQVDLPVVVNHAFAAHFFGGSGSDAAAIALGRHFRQGTGGVNLHIVGVAANVAVQQLGPEQFPQAYFPTEANISPVHVELRSALPVAQLAAATRKVLATLDPTLPLYNVRTMDQVVADNVEDAQLQQSLMAGFALLALLLAAAGIYGVMAWLVSARNREIGVRMALGATPAAVVRLVTGRGLKLAGGGMLLGTVGALAAGRLAASQLFQTPAFDPAALLAALAVLAAASFLAAWLPARRAARVDPALTLRQ